MSVSWESFFTLWMLLAAGLAAAVGAAYALRGRRARGPHRRARLYRCAACARVYEDRRNVPLSPCPRCGTLNDAAPR